MRELRLDTGFETQAYFVSGHSRLSTDDPYYCVFLSLLDALNPGGREVEVGITW